MPLLNPILDIPICPHCRINSPNLPVKHFLEHFSQIKKKNVMWGIYVCQRCGGVVTANAQKSGAEVEGVFPSLREIDQNLPPKILAYLQQAYDSIHSPAASIMVAASAIDEMLKQKNLLTGTLDSRIKKAAKDGIITEDMSKWAHNVRLDANDQRHADVNAGLPVESDAQRCLDFALALAEFLFVLPAKVQRGIVDSGNP